MAQIVGYWQDNVEFEEGPFVMVHAGGWRIEVEVKNHKCPCLPELSIYNLLDAHSRRIYKTGSSALAAQTVDWLNEQVRAGKIVLQGKIWVAPEYERR